MNMKQINTGRNFRRKQFSNSDETIKRIAIPTNEFSGEAAVAVLLIKWLPEYREYEVFRTDDPEIYQECSFKLCFAENYNHSERYYPRKTTLAIPGYPEKVSTGGLIFHHYGERAIASRFQVKGTEDTDNFRYLMKRLYQCIIFPIDTFEELDPKKNNENRIDSDIVRLSKMLDPSDDPDPYIKQYYFASLMNLIEEQFAQRVIWITKNFIPSRVSMKRAMEERKKVYPTGEIVLVQHYVPILQCRDIIDPDESRKQSVKYIIMARPTGDAIVHVLNWRSNCKRLKYAGKSGEQLTGVLQNISGSGWVHSNGALAEWNSIPNALEYAKQVLKSQPDKQGPQ